MKTTSRVLLCCLAVAASGLLAGCESRTDEADAGILLSGSINDTNPVISVNTGLEDATLELPVTLRSVILSGGSNLQNVELRSYEVTFTRADAGTRVPPPQVRILAAVIPAGGALTIPTVVMSDDQIFNPPISDLLFVNGGLDRETNDDSILLNVRIRFFGRTISGREVESNLMQLTIQLVR